jgi:hypothetical protein
MKTFFSDWFTEKREFLNVSLFATESQVTSHVVFILCQECNITWFQVIYSSSAVSAVKQWRFVFQTNCFPGPYRGPRTWSSTFFLRHCKESFICVANSFALMDECRSEIVRYLRNLSVSLLEGSRTSDSLNICCNLHVSLTTPHTHTHTQQYQETYTDIN